MPSSVFDFTQRLARTMIPGPGSLTQQILADTAIARVPALTAHQLTEATLRSYHAFPGWLLE
jgi:hypothetical protein